MGTNYYVDWAPPGSSTVSIQLHICKSLDKFQGDMFGSWRQWKEWLTYQGERLTIVDEYSENHDLEEFIRDVEAVPMEARRRQTKWVMEHPEYGTDRDWWDADGYSFHRGEFF